MILCGLILFIWIFELGAFFLESSQKNKASSKYSFLFKIEFLPYFSLLYLYISKPTNAYFSVLSNDIIDNKVILYLSAFIIFQKTLHHLQGKKRSLDKLIRDLSYGLLILISESFLEGMGFFVLSLLFLVNAWAMNDEKETDIFKKGRVEVLFFFLFITIHIFIQPSPNSLYLLFFYIVIISSSLGLFPFYKLSFYKTESCFEAYIPFQIAALYILLPRLSKLTYFNIPFVFNISFFEFWLIVQGLIIMYHSIFYVDLRTRAYLFLQTQILNLIIAVRLFPEIDTSELFSIILIIYAFYYVLVLSLRLKSLYFSLLVVAFSLGIIETPFSSLRFNLIKELIFVDEHLLAALSTSMGFISILLIVPHLRGHGKISLLEQRNYQ